MRAAFSEKFQLAMEEGSILRKTVVRIAALIIATSLLFALFLYGYDAESFGFGKLTLKNLVVHALLPVLMGAMCAAYVYLNIIHHIRKIIEELSKDTPDWQTLENEYMESDIKSPYVAIRRLHDTLSDKQRVEEVHAETRRVLDKLNSRIDNDQRELARHLHDDINPKLVLIKLELYKLAPLFNKYITDSTQHAAASKIVSSALDFADSAYEDSRNIIRSTHVELIDAIGLQAAIESLVYDYRKVLSRLNIELDYDLPDAVELPNTATISVFRIIQEALLNATKHSHAKNITISIQYDDNSCCVDVTVIDDGIGIQSKADNGVGLIDMRERARGLGSMLSIESGPEGGTKIGFSFECAPA